MKFDSIAHLFTASAPRVVAPVATPVTAPAAKIEPAAVVAPVAAPAPVAAAPTVTDNIPGLEEPAVAVPANIAAWLDANATTVNAYLIRVSWLPAGKVWRDLPADKLQLVISKPGHFARAASIPALK
jgi:hypothetical protein